MKNTKRILAMLFTLLILICAELLGLMNVNATDTWVRVDGKEVNECVEAWPSGVSSTAGSCTCNTMYSNFNPSSRDSANTFFDTSKISNKEKMDAFKQKNSKDNPILSWFSGDYSQNGNFWDIVRIIYQMFMRVNLATIHAVTYNYSFNGGSSATKTSEFLVEGAAIDLSPTAIRAGWTFVGWNTNPSAVTALCSLQMGKENVTLYAIFRKASTNIYYLGEETYSFEYYSDDDSRGHCFGMSVTSSAYYIGALSMSAIGGNDIPLYSFSDSSIVRNPICYYQQIQGPGAEHQSIVAGGSMDLYDTVDTLSDWRSCVNYIKDHQYDHKGTLNVGVWFDKGGHAVNFLYYKEVNGQQRIYVYDNNHPDFESYFYLAADGYIYEGPVNDFGAIIGFDLMDVNSYSNLALQFNRDRYIYAEKDEIYIEGAKMYNMKCTPQEGLYVMYEIPESTNEVTIKPLSDNASFQYLDKQYSFGGINEKTHGVLKIEIKDGGRKPNVTFKIAGADTSNACPLCCKVHDGSFVDSMFGLLHLILYRLTHFWEKAYLFVAFSAVAFNSSVSSTLDCGYVPN